MQGRHDVTVYHSVANDGKDVPIVVLLHGVYGSNNVWMDLGGAHEVYENLKKEGLSDFILVMPSDGGLWDGTAYLPLVDEGDFERWIVDDVIDGVISNIDGATSNSAVYISGLSMGGYGALRLGSKYPDKFAGISAHSSVTSMSDLQGFIHNSIEEYQCEFPQESDISYWLTQNKQNLPPIRFDCGTKDTLYASNIALKNKMTDLSINYVFESLDGSHEWPYWHRNLAKTLNFFHVIENT